MVWCDGGHVMCPFNRAIGEYTRRTCRTCTAGRCEKWCRATRSPSRQARSASPQGGSTYISGIAAGMRPDSPRTRLGSTRVKSAYSLVPRESVHRLGDPVTQMGYHGVVGDDNVATADVSVVTFVGTRAPRPRSETTCRSAASTDGGRSEPGSDTSGRGRRAPQAADQESLVCSAGEQRIPLCTAPLPDPNRGHVAKPRAPPGIPVEPRSDEYGGNATHSPVRCQRPPQTR